jgi:FeS assembly SUF system protein
MKPETMTEKSPEAMAPEQGGTPSPPTRALDANDIEALRLGVVEALHTVYDPEIPVDIYELGLIYDIDIDSGGNVAIRMTLTAPGCPVAGSMPDMVKDAVGQVEDVGQVDVELVWDPPWDRSRMSETAQLALGMI